MANVVADHYDLFNAMKACINEQILRQYFFDTNYFRITTSGPRKFSKTRGLKVTYFHFSSTKNIPNGKHELVFMQLSFFINKIKNLRQF